MWSHSLFHSYHLVFFSFPLPLHCSHFLSLLFVCIIHSSAYPLGWVDAVVNFCSRKGGGVSVHGYYFMTLTSIRCVHIHIYSFFRSYVRFEWLHICVCMSFFPSADNRYAYICIHWSSWEQVDPLLLRHFIFLYYCVILFSLFTSLYFLDIYICLCFSFFSPVALVIFCPCAFIVIVTCYIILISINKDIGHYHHHVLYYIIYIR